MLASGGFVIGWQAYEQDGFSTGIYARVYNVDGTPSGDELQVDQDGVYIQGIIALAEGGFVVIWQTTASGEGNVFEGQVYDAVGRVMRDNFTMNLSFDQNHPYHDTPYLV